MVNFFVSVVIPTYNRANDLERCLKSLQNQSFKNFEILVCDDGSTDNTEEVIRRFDSILTIQYIKDENFGGPARPRNNGIKKANGNVIAFLDSDDWWYPNKLEVSLQFMNDYDLVHHDLDIYTSIDKSKKVAKGRDLKGNFYKDLLINGNAIVNSSVIIKKEILDLVGEITEDIRLIAVEDYDYWIRVCDITNRVKYINISLGAYWVGGNISYSTKQIEREGFILNKYINSLKDNEKKEAVFRLDFDSARRWHYFYMFNEAKKAYLKSINSTQIDVKIKSLIGYLFSYFKIKI
jgi:glycosyltransferase involved in cell wall biosynthesis